MVKCKYFDGEFVIKSGWGLSPHPSPLPGGEGIRAGPCVGEYAIMGDAGTFVTLQKGSLQFFSGPCRIFPTVNNCIDPYLFIHNPVVNCKRESFREQAMISFKKDRMDTSIEFKRF